ncbi:MAG: hypothetical protein AB7O62_26475 [Pirellulales bacterium]
MAWLFANESLKPMFLAAFALAAGLLIYRLQVRRGGKRPLRDERSATDRTRRSQLMPGKSYDDARVELHDLSREIIGKIDSKLALLEQLIRDARQESARLESLLQQTRHAPPDPAPGSEKPHE